MNRLLTSTASTRWRGWLREFGMLALLLGGILAARSTLADHYVVPSGSMEHTLYPGDRVLVDKRAYGLRIPFTRIEILDGSAVARGDVVIFDSPTDGTRLVKRIVGVAGDRVAVRNGRVAVNGISLGQIPNVAVERFGARVARLNLESGGGPDLDVVVPPDQVLAIGDHRGNSRDSRYFGLVSEKSVYARAVAVYWRRDEGAVWKDL
jgi:signal peptidase I